MSGWRVWRASAQDLAALVRLERLAFGERSWGENNVRESIVAPRVTVLMVGLEAKQPSDAAGFAMWRDLGGEAELLAIGVDPAKRRQGAAQALLTAAQAQALAAGASRLYLEVDAANAAALALYRAGGFQQTGLRKAYYRDGADAALMQRVL